MANPNDPVRTRLAFLRLAEELGNVTEACRIMGFSRDSYYRFRKLFREHGEDGLRSVARSRANHKNRVPKEVEETVIRVLLEHPDWGKRRVAAAVSASGVEVAPSTVRSIWIRNELDTRARRVRAQQIRAAAGSTPPVSDSGVSAAAPETNGIVDLPDVVEPNDKQLVPLGQDAPHAWSLHM